MSTENKNQVSIICRTLGRPELQEALRSISSQDYANIEIILVDAATIFWNENAVYYYTLVANDFSNDLGCP